MKLLEMKHIRKSFREGLTVLNDLSLTVEKGEVLVLIGSSGSGKSTVLRCAAQLETVDSGEIDICGRVLVRTGQKTDRRGKTRDVAVYAPAAERKQMLESVGMVFQSFNLFPHMTVLRNITDAPVRVLGKKKDDAERDALALLETMGLADRADAYPCELSGGQ
ncbi:MAG: ATP-binding cassette domain-containing protein, partial [Eubacteriales bacterium]|nr:ATP-binding cassette domain-containing protein [Eubacteriales bacterium]